MGVKVEPGKVLPICDVATLGTSDEAEKDAHNGERRRAVSRMKELLRWAAAAKGHKGAGKAWKALYLKSRLALKAQRDDATSNSSRLSFRWDVASCSTTSSIYSPLSLASAGKNHDHHVHHHHSHMQNFSASLLPSSDRTSTASTSDNLKEERVRTGHWITTDSDFVVLEL